MRFVKTADVSSFRRTSQGWGEVRTAGMRKRTWRKGTGSSGKKHGVSVVCAGLAISLLYMALENSHLGM